MELSCLGATEASFVLVDGDFHSVRLETKQGNAVDFLFVVPGRLRNRCVVHAVIVRTRITLQGFSPGFLKFIAHSDRLDMRGPRRREGAGKCAL